MAYDLNSAVNVIRTSKTWYNDSNGGIGGTGAINASCSYTLNSVYNVITQITGTLSVYFNNTGTLPVFQTNYSGGRDLNSIASWVTTLTASNCACDCNCNCDCCGG